MKLSIVPVMLIMPVLLVGCTDTKSEQQVNIEEVVKEQNVIDVENATNVDVASVFEGIWMRRDEQEDRNIYLKIREDRYEYQTNKECFLTYESVERVEIDEVAGRITLHLASHDEQEFKTYIDVIDSETIKISGEENKEGIIHTKVSDKEKAAKDLLDIWGEYFDHSYTIEDFLECK